MPSVENLLGINLQKCTHMGRLKDKRHGGYMFVPCGHCTNCVTNYRNNLARRLDLEKEGSVSSLFLRSLMTMNTYQHFLLHIRI